MKTFPVIFNTGQLELSAIVTAYSNNHKFKVELVTGEPDPILLKRSEQGSWSVENSGRRNLSSVGFTELENVIDSYLDKNPVLRPKRRKLL